MLLHGLLSFPLTPFTPDDEVDTGVLADHVAQQIAAGPAGLFVACGTGEYTALNLDEYRRVVRTAVRESNGRLPVVAGAGGGPQQAREFARAAAECGADGLLLLPPYLVTSTPAGLIRHVAYVAGATGLPLVVYQRANAVLDPASALALLDIPTVAGIKDGRGDVDAMTRLVTTVRGSGHPRAEGFGFLNGLPTAEVSATAYRAIGVPSYSSAALCFVPDLATAFHRAHVAGDELVTRTLLAEFYLPLVALRDKVAGYAVALPKAGAILAGLPMGSVRPPLVDAAPEHVEQLAALIEAGRAALRRVTTPLVASEVAA
ncbi:5-dehydro-4-deoxyglucarate dehydratase [Spirilliplanes yamanashiensis]|uniref:Probable 5-dehydro-4-deoxyglucarate dehydratase n=1 Tax=Spirilliplanes yamanashiensis TaxID=42233 RepID=A0A8J3YCT0_9ACTN|nr:5-dehydro-4-deoxyglucarate dehydratase [Spirilliplanes yamanashiensis]MDP9819042.1 5-dehydro-4-deoxyglucarate dehydratase [Spirilliplanes yamanashiensis]GIJ05497.1 putative 5-dehydro-4-deoxyglucarate dehydratase [Spirilliplanes yamanashiensis]